MLFKSSKLKFPDEDYETYIVSSIRRYDKLASRMRIIHHALQLVILIGAALVTLVVGISVVPKVIPIVLSGVVTIATAITNYYKFGERSRELFFTSEDMALEYNRFRTKRGPYKNLDTEESLSLLMDRIEDSFYDQRQRILAVEKQSTEQK